MKPFAKKCLEGEFRALRRALKRGTAGDARTHAHLCAIMHLLSGAPRDCLTKDQDLETLVARIYLLIQLRGVRLRHPQLSEITASLVEQIEGLRL